MTPTELDLIRSALVGHQPRQCMKCGGYGWQWHHELDHVEVPNRSDPTKYTCDACGGGGTHDRMPGGTVASLVEHIDTLDALLLRFQTDHDAYALGREQGEATGRTAAWQEAVAALSEMETACQNASARAAMTGDGRQRDLCDSARWALRDARSRCEKQAAALPSPDVTTEAG